MTTDNRTNEPKQTETKSGQAFCFTEDAVERAALAVAEVMHPRWLRSAQVNAAKDRGSLIHDAGRAALVAAQGAAPHAESDDSPTPGNHATEEALEHLESLRYKGTVEYADYVALHDLISAIAPVLPPSPVDEALERAKLTIEGLHQVHGVECLCGFKSNRSRSRTEHITYALKAEWLKEQGR